MPEIRHLGKWDRAARVAIGMGLVALIGRADEFNLWTLGVAVAGTALLITGLAGSCMLYPLLGLRSSRRRSR